MARQARHLLPQTGLSRLPINPCGSSNTTAMSATVVFLTTSPARTTNTSTCWTRTIGSDTVILVPTCNTAPKMHIHHADAQNAISRLCGADDAGPNYPGIGTPIELLGAPVSITSGSITLFRRGRADSSRMSARLSDLV